MDTEGAASLKALLEGFPPELPEPPGCDPAKRPEPLRSAGYALKGSPVEVVRRKAEALAELAEEVRACKRCGLADLCAQKVFGIGHPDTRLVFVGEAPGAEEDRMGYPFVGRAGQLLTAMIESGMRLRREQVYICNILKCRPPNNRTPAADEVAACQEHLWRQLQILEPELIVALGAPAAQTLLATKTSIGRLRGRFYDLPVSGSALLGGPTVKCLPTFHPAYLLRNPADKKKAWEDLQQLMKAMGIPVPARR